MANIYLEIHMIKDSNFDMDACEPAKVMAHRYNPIKDIIGLANDSSASDANTKREVLSQISSISNSILLCLPVTIRFRNIDE